MAQSILVKNLSNYQDKFDTQLLDLANKHLLYKRFMIGGGMDYKKMMFVKSFHKLLCTDNCDLIDYIQLKIEGKLSDCEKPRTFCQAYKEYKKSHDCSITDAVSSCVGEIQW